MKRSNCNSRSRSAQPSCTAAEDRISLARLPAWTQSFWTWLSAISLPARVARWRWKPWQHIALTVVIALAAAAIGTVSVEVLFKVTVSLA